MPKNKNKKNKSRKSPNKKIGPVNDDKEKDEDKSMAKDEVEDIKPVAAKMEGAAKSATVEEQDAGKSSSTQDSAKPTDAEESNKGEASTEEGNLEEEWTPVCGKVSAKSPKGAEKENKDSNKSKPLSFSGAAATVHNERPSVLQQFRKVLEEKDRHLAMTRDQKRKLYKCGKEYVTLDKVPCWPNHYKEYIKRIEKLKPTGKNIAVYEVDDELNSKISLYQGNITCLEVDGVVNAANSGLYGGGGIDGAIHAAAGPALMDECKTLGGCPTGQSKTTAGYRLPAKYVIHTVGPTDGSEQMLRSCYRTSFSEMQKHNMTSIALCCVATGIYGYPPHAAVHVALQETRDYLMDLKKEGKLEAVERIVFCLFMDSDLKLYETWAQIYFPLVNSSQPLTPTSPLDSDTLGEASAIPSEDHAAGNIIELSENKSQASRGATNKASDDRKNNKNTDIKDSELKVTNSEITKGKVADRIEDLVTEPKMEPGESTDGPSGDSSVTIEQKFDELKLQFEPCCEKSEPPGELQSLSGKLESASGDCKNQTAVGEQKPSNSPETVDESKEI